MPRPAHPPFTDWLARIAQGDHRAFGRLFEHFYQTLLRLALFYVRTREAAEEVVLDVFTKVWLRRDQAAQIDNIGAYLTTAVKNQSLHHLDRKPGPDTVPLDDVPEPLAANAQLSDPDSALVDAELQARVRWAVAQLPPRCGLVWELVREQGLTYAQTAEALSISIRTVETQMSIALQRLAEACGVKL
jgi:RNA polymerase sigma-70 factor (family 1)